MKYTIDQHATFTTTRYTCDLCERCLLQGQRPLVCEVCQREVCGDCHVWLSFDLVHYGICLACSQQTNMLNALNTAVKQFHRAQIIIKSWWAEASKYILTAMRRAQYEQMEDGEWFASIPGFEGLWASGPSVEEAREQLLETLYEWISVHGRKNHLPDILI